MINLVIKTVYLMLAMLAPVSWVAAAPGMIAYHSPLTGLLQECNCEGGRKGGVARLKTHIDGIRSGNTEAILVSPGNWLNYYSDTSADSLCLRLLPAFEFDAIALGPLDLINGAGFFTSLGKPDSLPWVNCNLSIQGQPIARPFRIISRKWGSTLVTGAISEESFHEIGPAGIPPGIELEDPVSSLRRVVESTPASISAMVVVSYLDAGQEQRFLDGCDLARPVILLHSGDISRLDTARCAASKMVAEMGRGGRCVGTIEVNGIGPAMRLTQEILDATHAQDPALARIVDLHYRIRGTKDEVSVPPPAARSVQNAGMNRAPLLTLYYAPGCPDCHRLILDALEPLERRGNLRLELVDISETGNYQRLMTAQQRTGISTKRLPVALFKGKLADGIEAIRGIIKPMN